MPTLVNTHNIGRLSVPLADLGKRAARRAVDRADHAATIPARRSARRLAEPRARGEASGADEARCVAPNTADTLGAEPGGGHARSFLYLVNPRADECKRARTE